MIRRPASLVLLAALLSTGVTAVAVLIPQSPLVYEPSPQRIALETTATLVAFLTSFLFVGRYRRTRRLDQLATAMVLAVLALANLVVVAILVAGPDRRTGWDLVIGAHLAAAILFVTAAFMPISRPRRPLRAMLVLGAGLLIVLVVADAAIHALAGTLPGAVPQPAYGDTDAHVERHVGITTVQLLAGSAFAAAAFGLVRRSRRTGDELLAWLAVAALFAASAQINYLLVPPWRLDWVHAGDIFRLLVYAVLLLAALREIGSYWQHLAQNAVLEERRRIARELHDGLAQELTFIHRRARLLDRQADPTLVRQIIGATERAVDASRRAIAVLTRPLDEPLDQVLAQVAEDVAARGGIGLSLSLARDVDVPREVREALVRVACEAITNAAKHAEASRVRLELDNGRPVRMRIVDDGVGFDPDTRVNGEGFGLSLMRERAKEVGAQLAVRSTPGGGTTVEVELP